MDELGEVMEYLKEIGGYVTKNDGMHVHHDASDFVAPRVSVRDYDAYFYSVVPPPTKAQEQAHERVMRVLETYRAHQKVIDRLVDPYRRGWQDLSKAPFTRWKAHKSMRTGRYNVHFSSHGTFEFRQFEGCLDPARAFAWIEFGQHFLNYAKNLQRIPTCATTAKHLLKNIGCSAHTQRALIDRPRRSKMPDKAPEGAPAPCFGDYAVVRAALGIKTPYVEREV